MYVARGGAVSNQWARYLLNYLYAVSDDDYDDDDEVCTCVFSIVYVLHAIGEGKSLITLFLPPFTLRVI